MAWYLLPVLCSPVCQSVCISLHLYVCMCVCVSHRATRFKNASVNDSHAHVQIRVKQSAVSVCLSSVSIGNHKTLCLALEYVKICRSGVLFIALGGSSDQILVSKVYKVRLCMHNRLYKVTNQFLLWRTRWGSLFSCFVFCSCSLVSCNCFTVNMTEPLATPHYICIS